MTSSILTVERLREVLRYEPDTGDFFWRAKIGRKIVVGQKAGSFHCQRYIAISIDNKDYLAHRLAWFYVHGVMPEKDIDHINMVRHDNRIENLRSVNRSVNMQNQKKPLKNNKLGFLGVHKYKDRFIASITVTGIPKHLGIFSTPELAHAAYIEAKRKHHAGCTI
jgi:hypothetical protein